MSKYSITEGDVFDKLTALTFSHRTVHGDIYWNMRCECGNELVVHTRRLFNGKKTSCGCDVVREYAHEIPIGTRFGKLVVSERVKVPGKNLQYLCDCDCGNKALVLAIYLTTNQTKSCGCYKGEYARELSDKNTKYNIAVGDTFGRLTVEEIVVGKGNRKYSCCCSCGSTKKVVVRGASLATGNTKSCGCLKSELASERRITHGKSNTNTFSIYRGMKNRCCNPRSKHYSNYGARGIVVSEEWLNSYEVFLADMGERPGKAYSLDRIDNDGPYSKDNCRWATRAEQGINKRNTVYVIFQDQKVALNTLANEYNINRTTVSQRIKNGWSVEDAVLTKPRAKPTSAGVTAEAINVI